MVHSYIHILLLAVAFSPFGKSRKNEYIADSKGDSRVGKSEYDSDACPHSKFTHSKYKNFSEYDT